MALTLSQLQHLGFKPTKKESPFKKKYDTLIYPLNKTDYLELGYDSARKETNYKIIWKSFVLPETGERIRYVVTKLADTGYMEMKDFLSRSVRNANYKPSVEQETLKEINGVTINGYIDENYKTLDTTEIIQRQQENTVY